MKSFLKKGVNLLLPNYLNDRYKRKLNKQYVKERSHFIGRKKIVYVLTTPPSHTNIGDQAQVLAIKKWFEKYFPEVPVLEVEKQDCLDKIDLLKKIIHDDDLIFIHSGGNLGDRHMWSERGRRSIVKHFPENKIIQLPQTIYFSDTRDIDSELANSKEIYNNHKDLTILARDPKSEVLGLQYFPDKMKFAIPDFVLSIDNIYPINVDVKKGSVLFCLRNDNESVFENKHREELYSLVSPFKYEIYDTTLDRFIYEHTRKTEIINLLEYFASFEAIITDRYHGLIFSTIVKKPTIVLPTDDHKLSSAIEWFSDIPYIKMLKMNSTHLLKKELQAIIDLESDYVEDWNKKYFKHLKTKLGLDEYFKD